MRARITVEQVLRRKAVVVKPTDTVDKAAKVLARAKVGSAVVMEGEDIVGIVTDRDILDKVVAIGKNPKEVKIEEIMSRSPVKIEYDYEIQDAIDLMMDKGIRRLLVTRLGRPVGFITAADLLAALANFNSREEEEEVEEPEVYGFCEVCGQYGTLFEIRGKWVCESCKDLLEEQ